MLRRAGRTRLGWRADLPLGTHPHHEAMGVDVAELCRFEDIALMFGEKGVHRTDDARAVAARQGEDGA